MVGSKDNIIWSSYINYLKEEHDNFDKIIFVNNDSDYVIRTQTEISLADDLLRDLDEYEIDKEKVTVVSDLRDLNEKILQPVLPVVKEFNIQLRDNIKMVFMMWWAILDKKLRLLLRIACMKVLTGI